MSRAWASWTGVPGALVVACLSFAGEELRVQSERVNLSLRLEIEHALDRGTAWVRAQQSGQTGSWGNERMVTMTGLALTAILFARDESGRQLDPVESRGFAFLQGCLVTRGGERRDLRDEDWARALPALFLIRDRPEIKDLIRKGAAILESRPQAGWEAEFGRREVLRTARMLGLAQDGAETLPPGGGARFALGEELRFRYLDRVRQSWAGAQAGPEAEAWDKWAKLGFAQHLKSTDVRLHEAMAKGLLAGQVDRVLDERGREVNWREKLALRLFDLQQRDGHWAGEIPAGDGADEVLESTCRALLALQIIVRSL